MEQSYPRLCITSTGGGGGKTLLSLGLCRAFQQKGIDVKPFKKGPDYIDAAWLGAAAGCPSSCLDPFFMTGEQLTNFFCSSMAGHQLAVIEGNRGLFDGLNESGICSTSNVARTLKCPLILCIDCAKSTRTMAAVLNGLLNFEPGLIFAGAVLNRVGSLRHANSLRAAIEGNTDLDIIGILPRLDKSPLPERHMGIASFGVDLAANIEEILDFLAQYILDNCEVYTMLEAARHAPQLQATDCNQLAAPNESICRIGIVRDEALWFYYPENLAALEQAGAKLIYLSLFDESEENYSNWHGIDGLYLGGGFPEDMPDKICSSPFLGLIREYSENGKPVYAECGGLMILCNALQKGANSWPMAGLFPCNAIIHKKPQGLGYVEALVTADNPWHKAGTTFLGHEFHYSRCEWIKKPERVALALKRGIGIYRDEADGNLDGLIKNNVWASYTHIFAPANPDWAKNFVALACANK